ncbi:acyl-CoA dehydrogenase family protein [Prolixibacter denitrificans]|uniref:Acyl-CoA dehydrogenase n=1 Tax=Prolixibacter denitrificans TaxID=1541063 RepID=A0A2P8CDU6_9BACT|nr:acyl-CoA dehydrogenase family protein [Prolixibacter denitrificans]PSK83079.1 alkylation response protein AidB-like acyl-CoA dehydrogenase [Prolixibacter denitrificans]GET22036.1 acyl-CoA dehydrogenase [Prolixibacter denitrificans]
MDELLPKHYADYRKRIRDFAEKEVHPVAIEHDENEHFPVDLARKMGEAGLFGIAIPKEYGGQGLDTLSYIIAVEELARVDSSPAATIAAHNSLGIAPIYSYGTEEQKQKYIPGLCTGEKLWAFGLTELTAGSDAKGVASRAELVDGEWVVNGSKMFITNSASEIASGITLQAITGEKDGKKELTAILVPRETPGYETWPVKGKLMWRSVDNGKMKFTDCRVPEENMLGKRGEGIKIMLATLDGGRLSIAAMGLGLAQGAFEMAVKHAKKREQFGKPIAEFQAVSFKLAEMAMRIELARNTLYRACQLKDAGKPFGKEAAMSKLYCSEVAKFVADESVQVHGAYGLLRENHIERFYRDQRLLQIGEGTSEILRMVIGRYVLKS